MLSILRGVRGFLNRASGTYTLKKTWPLGLILPATTGLMMYLWRIPHHAETVDDEANRYIPIQSDSERAAGHPFVGSY